MNTLDSRSLHVGNCYAQPFEVEGEYRYILSPGIGAAHLRGEDERQMGYLIKVGKRKAGADTAQHTVHVSKKGAALAPDVENLDIAVGDIVVWYTADPAVTGFCVAGSNGKVDFGSGDLKAGAVFTHAFGSVGKIEWCDPSVDGLDGVVEISQPDLGNDAKMKSWYSTLEKPATIEIRKGKATPARVKIVVGQTVFWKVWDGNGVAIRERRLSPG